MQHVSGATRNYCGRCSNFSRLSSLFHQLSSNFEGRCLGKRPYIYRAESVRLLDAHALAFISNFHCLSHRVESNRNAASWHFRMQFPAIVKFPGWKQARPRLTTYCFTALHFCHRASCRVNNLPRIERNSGSDLGSVTEPWKWAHRASTETRLATLVRFPTPSSSVRAGWLWADAESRAPPPRHASSPESSPLRDDTRPTPATETVDLVPLWGILEGTYNCGVTPTYPRNPPPSFRNPSYGWSQCGEKQWRWTLTLRWCYRILRRWWCCCNHNARLFNQHVHRNVSLLFLRLPIFYENGLAING